MKKIIMLIVLLISFVSFAQEQVNPQIEKVGNETKATYFHDNGAVKQQGFFNANGKLQGTWTSYDAQGNKLAIGNYDNGRKVGKWFFWSDDILREVDFVEFKIASVNEWKNESKLATRN